MDELIDWLRPTRTIGDYLDKVVLPQSRFELDPQRPLEFRSRVPWRVLLALPLFLAAFCFMLTSLKGPSYAIPLAVIFGLGFVVQVVYSVMRLGWSITMDSEGIAFRCGRSRVDCPWALFDCDGTPHANSAWERALLPIREEYVADIVKRRDGRNEVSGLRAATWQVAFPQSSKMMIRGYYGIDLGELAEYISQLAFGAAGNVSDSTIKNESHGWPQPIRPGSRWRIIDLVRIKFPDWCCGCNSRDFRWREIESNQFFARLLHMPSGHVSIALPIPICARCERRVWRVLIVGGLAGYLLGFPTALLLLYLDQWRLEWWDVLGASVIALAPGGLAMLAALPFAQRVRLSKFSERAQTVRIWVRNRNFWPDETGRIAPPQEPPARGRG